MDLFTLHNAAVACIVLVQPFDCCIKAALSGMSAALVVRPWAKNSKQVEARPELTGLSFLDQAN